MQGPYPGGILTTISTTVAIPELQARELIVGSTKEAQRAEVNAALESARRYLKSVDERESGEGDPR